MFYTRCWYWAEFGTISSLETNGLLLPQQGFIPKSMYGLTLFVAGPDENIVKVPMVERKFTFPTSYEDSGIVGDKLWNDLMPRTSSHPLSSLPFPSPDCIFLLLVGAGFIRVPHPRLYDLPPSQIIKGDPEEAELYSLSVTHQLHCLAVLRHVIIKYEKHDKSRFAGGGHEYHCLDYSPSPNPFSFPFSVPS